MIMTFLTKTQWYNYCRLREQTVFLLMSYIKHYIVYNDAKGGLQFFIQTHHIIREAIIMCVVFIRLVLYQVRSLKGKEKDDYNFKIIVLSHQPDTSLNFTAILRVLYKV